MKLIFSTFAILFLFLLGLSNAASYAGVECVDSDSGANLYVRGTGTGYYSNGGGPPDPNVVIGENGNSASRRTDSSLNGTAIFYDHCENSETSNQLNEVQCDSGLGMLVSYAHACQYGCRDGACVQCSGQTCNPSDNSKYCSNGNWASCSSGQVCSAGACVATCTGTQCNPNNAEQICNQGQWNNCQLSYVCRNSACVSGCNGTTCNPTNSEQYCSNGNWVSCSSGAYCSNGACVGAQANASASANISQSTSSSANVSLPVSQPSIPLPVQLNCVVNTCNFNNNRVVCSGGQWVECPGNGTCNLGVCVVVNQTSSALPFETRGNASQRDSPEEVERSNVQISSSSRGNASERQEFQCSGCIVDGKCLPLGYRVAGSFCLLNGSLGLQKREAELCENHFECSSNVCASGKCVSADLVTQLIDFLKRLIGIT